MPVGLHGLDDVLHGGNVVVLHAPTQGVGEHLLGEVAQEQALARQEHLLERLGPDDHFTAGQLAAGIDPLAGHLGAPATDRVEVLQSESQRVQAGVTGSAIGILAMLLEALAEGQTVALLVIRGQGGHQRRRRRGRRSEDLFEQPFAPQHRAGPLGITRLGEHRGHAGDAAAAAVGQGDLRETGAGHPGQSIVPRQFGIHPGVIAVEQLEQAAVLAQQAGEELARLGHHGLSECRGELRELVGIGGGDRAQGPDAEPLARELFRQGPGLRIGQHPPHLGLEHPGL